MNSNNSKVSSYRWVVLAIFMLVAIISQLLWLNFASITTQMEEFFNVSAFEVSLLSLVWPLVFIIISIPVGVFIDKKGFKPAVTIGAILMAVFSILRILSTTVVSSFYLLLIFQTGAALGQPFVFSSISKLVESWFPENEHGLATGLGTIGIFIGMGLALVLAPLFYSATDLTGLLIISGVISLAGAVLFASLAKEGPGFATAKEEVAFSVNDLYRISRLKGFPTLEYGFFVGVGGFTAIATWLEKILNSLHGISASDAGIIGGIMILGGIFGSIIIPTISDKVGKIKPFILMDVLIGAGSFFLIGIISDYILIIIFALILGFFFMSALPLILEMSTKISGSEMAGISSSLLWFFSQIGSVILIAVVEPISLFGGTYFYPIVLFAVLWIIAFFLFLRINEVEEKT